MSLWDFIQRLWNTVAIWVVVCPWERGLRVRLGNRVTRLEPGFRLKLPIIDEIYKQSVRRRVCQLCVQVLSTRDGRTVHICGVLGYEITDLERLYQTLHHAEDTVRNIASAAIADYVVTHDATPDMPSRIEQAAGDGLDFWHYGLGGVTLQITDFAYVKTYRMITDSKWGPMGDMLSTTSPTTGIR